MFGKRISSGVFERTHFTVRERQARVSLRSTQGRFSGARRIGSAARRIAATALAQPEGSLLRAALRAFSESKALLPTTTAASRRFAGGATTRRILSVWVRAPLQSSGCLPRCQVDYRTGTGPRPV